MPNMKDFGTTRLFSLILKKGNDLDDSVKRKFNAGPTIPVKAVLACLFAFNFTYFYVIGRPRYVVESSLIVRRANDSKQTSGLSFTDLISGGNKNTLEDAFYVNEYIRSPDLMKKLELKSNIFWSYKKKLPDLLSGLTTEPTSEEKLSLFRNVITSFVNEQSGVINIRVIGYRPDAAYLISQDISTKIEEFISNLNQNLYQRQLEAAKREVDNSRAVYNQKMNSLSEFQKKNLAFDFTSEGVAGIGIVQALQTQLVAKKVELARLSRIFTSPSAEEVLQIKDEILHIERQISNEKKSLLSEGGKDIAAKSLQQEGLKADFALASEMYKAALVNAAATSAESSKQQRFVSVISSGFKPSVQYWYWRHKGFLTVMTIFLAMVGIAVMLKRVVGSHGE